MKHLRRCSIFLSLLVLLSAVVCSSQVSANTTDSTVYGGGNYGACNYGSCSITLTSGGTTTLNVLPTPTGSCTVQSDTASVLTDSSTGYNLTMTTSTTNNAMVGSSASIPASSGNAASPVTLAMNTWGYRVDGLSGFGSGPTLAQNSAAVPSVTFAGVPPSNLAGTPIASSVGPANPAVGTTVWYGLCADSTIPAATYTTTIVYTAVTN